MYQRKLFLNAIDFFYAMNSATKLDEILDEIVVLNKENVEVSLPVPEVFPDPYFPNNKFEFDLTTLLAERASTSFGIRLYIIFCTKSKNFSL